MYIFDVYGGRMEKRDRERLDDQDFCIGHSSESNVGDDTIMPSIWNRVAQSVFVAAGRAVL